MIMGLKTNYYENSLPYEQLFKGKFYAIIYVFCLFNCNNLLIINL